jgi:hypothetical protein
MYLWLRSLSHPIIVKWQNTSPSGECFDTSKQLFQCLCSDCDYKDDTFSGDGVTWNFRLFKFPIVCEHNENHTAHVFSAQCNDRPWRDIR